MSCAYCGISLDILFVYCPYCGKKIDKNNSFARLAMRQSSTESIEKHEKYRKELNELDAHLASLEQELDRVLALVLPS
jgi:DNA repair exonuclease SbcCD ATPase subunit